MYFFAFLAALVHLDIFADITFDCMLVGKAFGNLAQGTLFVSVSFASVTITVLKRKSRSQMKARTSDCPCHHSVKKCLCLGAIWFGCFIILILISVFRTHNKRWYTIR